MITLTRRTPRGCEDRSPVVVEAMLQMQGLHLNVGGKKNHGYVNTLRSR